MKRLGKFCLVKLKEAKPVYVLGDKMLRTTLIKINKGKNKKKSPILNYKWIFMVFFMASYNLNFKVIVGVTCCPRRSPRSAGGAAISPSSPLAEGAGPPKPAWIDDWLIQVSIKASRLRPTSHDAAHHGGGSAAAWARGSAGWLPLLLLRGGGGADGREG